MKKLARNDLLSLEQYSEQRSRIRSEVMAHKANRRVALGPNATLYFEDNVTMRYQVQEMLRAERIYEAKEIEHELETYNALIPDGSNWKATFMIEFPDVDERRSALARLVGVEDKVWVQVGKLERAWAIANEDMERSTQEKTSSVHFLRFELTPEMIKAAKSGSPISMGVSHDLYQYIVDAVPDPVRASLVIDLA